jgi:ubiquinone/menaquinone biosynthesis C-methylase UbiE
MLDLDRLAVTTEDFVARNIRVLQIHRFAKSEFRHVKRLERWAEIPHGARVADLGCGVGEVSRIFKQLRPDLSFCLVNISEAQLLYADPAMQRYTCSFLNIPEPDESFDAALFCFSIGHEDQAEAIAEARRILRPGGILFIYDMIRKSGDNKIMEEVGYTVWPRGHMESASIGFDLDYYMEPFDSGFYGKQILGEDYDKFFGGTLPAIWRFLKR